MADIRNLVSWMQRDLGRFAAFDSHVERCEAAGLAPGVKERFVIYTDTNRYNIVAHERQNDQGYLGCTSSTRKPRAGEDWTRGRDLHDGPLTEETWRRILCDIVSYEMVKVFGRDGIFEPSVVITTAHNDAQQRAIIGEPVGKVE